MFETLLPYVPESILRQWGAVGCLGLACFFLANGLNDY